MLCGSKGRKKDKEMKKSDAAQLFLGDCLDILPSLPAGSVDLVAVDLPYGTTACGWDSIIPLDRMWAELSRICKPDVAMVFTAQQPFTWRLCAWQR